MGSRWKLPKVGDRVIIPFGFNEKEAEVIRVSRAPRPGSVTVEFWLEGADEPSLTTLTVDRIRPVEPAGR